MSKRKVNTSVKRILNETDPRVIHYVDTVGNKEESIILETITINYTDGQRDWLRKHKNYVKGEAKLKEAKHPNPYSLKMAKELWERFLP